MKTDSPNSSLFDSFEVDENNLNEENLNLIKSFGEQIAEKKESFKKVTTLMQRKEEIKQIAAKLKTDIKNIEKNIEEILENQHKEYLDAFSTFMDTIKEEITTKMKEMEKMLEEKHKTNDVRLIKCERDFFKSEAVRLNNICKSYKEKINNLIFQNKLLNDELLNIKARFKETENINKQLLFELEANIKTQNETKKELDTTKNMLKNINISKVNNISTTMCSTEVNNNSSLNKNSIFDNKNKDDNLKNKQEIIVLNSLLTKSQNETKKEKEKTNKVLSKLNTVYKQKNKLEDIFNDCVEETKKLIFNRKIKDKDNSCYKKKYKEGAKKFDNKTYYNIKYQDFLPTDKQKTLENFIYNDEVYNAVKNTVFSRAYSQSQNKRKYIIGNSNNYSDAEWKTKNKHFKKELLPFMSLKNKGFDKNALLNKLEKDITSAS